MWATTKLLPYLMANQIDVYTDHYALQWFKSMRTGLALLHRWSAAQEEFNFMIHHWPGNVQTHDSGVSQLPMGQAPLKERKPLLSFSPWLMRKPHVWGDDLWKLFQDSLHIPGTNGFVVRSPNLAFSARLALIMVPRRKLLATMYRMGLGTISLLT